MSVIGGIGCIADSGTIPAHSVIFGGEARAGSAVTCVRNDSIGGPTGSVVRTVSPPMDYSRNVPVLSNTGLTGEKK